MLKGNHSYLLCVLMLNRKLEQVSIFYKPLINFLHISIEIIAWLKWLLFSGRKVIFLGEETFYSGRKLFFSGRETFFGEETFFYQGRKLRFRGENILYNKKVSSRKTTVSSPRKRVSYPKNKVSSPLFLLLVPWYPATLVLIYCLPLLSTDIAYCIQEVL